MTIRTWVVDIISGLRNLPSFSSGMGLAEMNAIIKPAIAAAVAAEREACAKLAEAAQGIPAGTMGTVNGVEKFIAAAIRARGEKQ